MKCLPNFTWKLVKPCTSHCNIYTEKVPVLLQYRKTTKISRLTGHPDPIKGSINLAVGLEVRTHDPPKKQDSDTMSNSTSPKSLSTRLCSNNKKIYLCIYREAHIAPARDTHTHIHIIRESHLVKGNRDDGIREGWNMVDRRGAKWEWERERGTERH